MVKNRIICAICLCFINTGIQAEIPVAEFKALKSSFEDALTSFEETLTLVDTLSSDQLLEMADLADKIYEAVIGAETNKKKTPTKLELPSRVKSELINDNQKVLVRSPAGYIPAMKDYGTNEPPRKRYKLDHQDVPPQPVFDEKVRNGIYVHAVFGDDYFENYIPHKYRIDAAKVLKELRRKYPWDQKKTLRKKLMLRVEINFRRLMRKNPNLIKVIKYVGLCEDDGHRITGHKSDLKNKIKIIGSTKAKYLKTALDSGYNIRMNTLVYNLRKNDLPLFEALVADIFPVQIFGCSARIADEPSKLALIEYKAWAKRQVNLKKRKLSRVVEDQTRSYLRRTLPIGREQKSKR